jgi:hypothetical protein
MVTYVGSNGSRGQYRGGITAKTDRDRSLIFASFGFWVDLIDISNHSSILEGAGD